MCGVAGVFITDGREGVIGVVERMIAALTHRGPDDQGISDFGFRASDSKSAIGDPEGEMRVVLGVRRLSIIDLSSAGHQPMQDEGTSLTIAYNGETYNFRELRDEIGDEFGSWRSNTDTEVVLRAYRKWGLKALAKFRGMFALAIWDERRQELILARDRFGIKPLYYYAGISDFEFRDADLKSEIRSRKSEFLFASEVRAMLASGSVPRNLSREGVASYLTYGSVEGPETIVQNVRLLMPGHYLRVRALDGGLQVREGSYTDDVSDVAGQGPPFNNLEWENATRPESRGEAVANLRIRLEESVKLHLVSDVPLGVFLSGGMDSSALVALVSHVTTEKPKTFSVVFDEEKFNESPHSRLVASRFQTEHREICLREDHLVDLLPAALGAMDQPTIDAVNTFVVSKAAKEAGVTVALSGLGGDELFAGYPSFRRALRLQNMSGLSRRLLRSASGIGRVAFGGSLKRNKFWELVESDGRPADVYNITRQLFAPHQVADLMASPSAITNAEKLANRESRSTKPPTARHDLRDSDAVNAISRLELQGYMANTLLRDIDAMSMAVSLEVRVPFVDAEVVRFVLSLPGEWKLNGSKPKPLLADALNDLLPKEPLQRPKMGFTLPFEKWMQSRLRKDISSVLEDEERSGKAALEPGAAANVWRSFLRSPDAVGWSRPWALYVLARWCEINGVSD